MVMVYNRFISALAQRLEVVELLPVPEEALTGAEPEAVEGSYIHEPDVREVLAALLPDLHRDDHLPRDAGVDRLGARRPDDGDAERLGERRRRSSTC